MATGKSSICTISATYCGKFFDPLVAQRGGYQPGRVVYGGKYFIVRVPSLNPASRDHDYVIYAHDGKGEVYQHSVSRYATGGYAAKVAMRLAGLK